MTNMLQLCLNICLVYMFEYLCGTRNVSHIFKFTIDIKQKNIACMLIIKLIMFKLKQKWYLLVETL
jgi:hypothetical protein